MIIKARDYTNRSLRVEKQYFIAQRKSSKDFSQHQLSTFKKYKNNTKTKYNSWSYEALERLKKLLA